MLINDYDIAGLKSMNEIILRHMDYGLIVDELMNQIGIDHKYMIEFKLIDQKFHI